MAEPGLAGLGFFVALTVCGVLARPPWPGARQSKGAHYPRMTRLAVRGKRPSHPAVGESRAAIESSGGGDSRNNG